MRELTPELKQLKQAFDRSDFTMDSLAEETNLSKRTIWRILNGKVSPRITTFNTMARPLGRRIVVGHIRKSA